MSVNKYGPRVLIIPEDRANEKIANGFVDHDQVKNARIDVMPPAGGWPKVQEKFLTEYIKYLRNKQDGFVVLLIDFDGKYESRRDLFDKDIPDDLKDRVFVIGVKDEPEDLPQEWRKALEGFGTLLADDCYKGTIAVWGHDHLSHNEPDRIRMVQTIRSILFPQ